MNAEPELFIEPVVGWRGWRIAEHGNEMRLISVTRGTEWTPRQTMEATCSLGHTPPVPSCSCGIYAAKSLAHLRQIDYQGHGVIGEVALWGEVIEAQLGWRATHAYPRVIYVPHTAWRHAKLVRETYDVRVKLANPYEGEV